MISKALDIEVCIRRVDATLGKLVDMSMEDPNFKVLTNIPGIGENLAARLIAEIGSVDKFDNAKQLVAYAGIDPIVYQSGKYEEKFSISKKGNKRLRCLLYLSVSCSLRLKSQPNAIKDYYKRKTQHGKPHKVALIACCNKLLRIIYTMCVTGTPYLYINTRTYYIKFKISIDIGRPLS